MTADLTLAVTNANSSSSDFRDGVVFWDVATGRRLRQLHTDEAGDFSVALSPSGNFAAAGTQKGRVLLWDLRNGDVRESFSAHPEAQPFGAAVTFSGDGRYRVPEARRGSTGGTRTTK